MSSILKASTAFNLGFVNLSRVISYRLSVKSRLNSVTRLNENLPQGVFFSRSRSNGYSPTYNMIKLNAFGYIPYSISESETPNWFYSPLTREIFSETTNVWYKIPDFNNEVGDIKGVWEASRFDWMIKFIEEYLRTDDEKAISTLDYWLNDWIKNNPAYLGPNWKCGQETSIRVMHIISGILALDRHRQINDNLIQLIEVHLKRIVPTISYAIAQDNNHGTSEATALYIGGAILNNNKPNKKYLSWQKLGEKWLNNRANKLIMSDGGFSQYSVNYHRVMLDSYCLSEIVRRKLNLRPFSKNTYQRLIKATDWLYIMTQDNGDAPNLGANDGAKLLPIGDNNYRDYRPTVQLASTLFRKRSYYNLSAHYDAPLSFFKIKKINKSTKLPQKSRLFKSSGLLTKHTGDFFIAFKLPIFKFRPSQCDALHLDVWLRDKNILRDGGTYSYNTNDIDLDYFSGVKSHNTVEFDDHLQMPRLSRFLFGAWLKPIKLRYKNNKFSCGYKDLWNCEHSRTITTSSKTIKVVDEVSGFKRHAILRWRLMPDDWKLKGNTLTNGSLSLEIKADSHIGLQIVEGYESRYYYQKTKLPVLEVIIKKPTTITTLIKDLV